MDNKSPATIQTEAETSDLKILADFESFMHGMEPDDLSLDDLVGQQDDHQLFAQQTLSDYNPFKHEFYGWTSDASSLYDDSQQSHHLLHHQLQLQQDQLHSGSDASADAIKSHLSSESDPFVTSLWSDIKLWGEIEPTVIRIKEEQLTTDCHASSSASDVAAKVVKASKQLGISTNPYMWPAADARKWAAWVLEKSGHGSAKYVFDSLNVGGAGLCSMHLDEFMALAPGVGESLFIELELWKCARQLYWPSSFSLSQDSTATDYSSGSSNYPEILHLSNPLVSSSPSSRSNPSIPSIHTFSAFTALPAAADNKQSSSNSNNSSSNNTGQHTQQPARPNTLAIQPVYFLGSDVNHHHHHHQQQSHGHHLQSQQQHLSTANDPILPQFSYFVSNSGNGYSSSPASNSSLLEYNYSNLVEVPGGSSNSSPTSSIPDFYDGVFGSQTDFLESTVQPARQGNQLWQFLKELLLQPCVYENCIRWLDRSKGIFKIEDSIKVAKLWGQRKNRPAMNYDKLSRSIRQYYKKGIIKKTSQSKRLVYQFCQQYA